MANAWESRGTVYLDGKQYHIKELLESDCYEPGTRFVSLSLVAVDSPEDDLEIEAPAGMKWAFVGKCPCRGQDKDCADDSNLWRLVNEDDEWCYGNDGEYVDLR